jgi:hypothetical protein
MNRNTPAAISISFADRPDWDDPQLGALQDTATKIEARVTEHGLGLGDGRSTV